MQWAVSVKAVLLRDGAVLLGQNQSGAWELPGGRMEPGESTRQTLVREVLEEAGIRVVPGGLVLAEPFEVVPGRTVFVVVYAATAGDEAIVRSDEHVALAFVPVARLADLRLADIYRTAIAAVAG